MPQFASRAVVGGEVDGAVEIQQLARVGVARSGIDITGADRPALVPSVDQSSMPLVPSLAAKYKRPLTLVSELGSEPVKPGSKSRTWTVPALVPSLFHNSEPLLPSVARKYNVPFTFVK